MSLSVEYLLTWWGLRFFLMIHVTKAVMMRMKRTAARIMMMLMLVLWWNWDTTSDRSPCSLSRATSCLTWYRDTCPPRVRDFSGCVNQWQIPDRGPLTSTFCAANHLQNVSVSVPEFSTTRLTTAMVSLATSWQHNAVMRATKQMRGLEWKSWRSHANNKKMTFVAGWLTLDNDKRVLNDKHPLESLQYGVNPKM